jgi:hypothetical protein
LLAKQGGSKMMTGFSRKPTDIWNKWTTYPFISQNNLKCLGISQK